MAAPTPFDATSLFRRDLIGGTTVLVSIDRNGGDGSARDHGADVSSNGQFVVFSSSAPNLLSSGTVSGSVEHVYVRDMTLGRTRLVSKTLSGGFPGADSYGSAISADGRFIVFYIGIIGIGRK